MSLEKNKSLEQNEDQNKERSESESDIEAIVKGTILLSNIYERCNLVLVELSNYVDLISSKAYIIAMKEKLGMIEKNET